MVKNKRNIGGKRLKRVLKVATRKRQSIDDELIASQRLVDLQKSRTLTIVNNLASAVIATNSLGRVEIYNAAALALLDTNVDLNGKLLSQIMPLIDEDDKRITLQSLLEKTDKVNIHDNFWYVLEDGERIRLELTISPIRPSFEAKTKKNEGFVLIMRDITRAKNLEEERDEFISVVSHELRTPITAVEGSLSNLEVMLEKDNFPKTKLKAALKLAHEQTLYLAKMVNDLSTLSRAERGIGDDIEEINVLEMIQKLYNTYSPKALKKGLAFDLDVKSKVGKVLTSRLYLEELLQNFITNAIRYTKEGSVTLQVKKTKDKIHFAVKDTGIGISKTDQEKIFKRFYRSEDYRTRETNGTGLGLYVAAKLADKLETKINIASRLNHGSTFSVELDEYHPDHEKSTSTHEEQKGVLAVPSK